MKAARCSGVSPTSLTRLTSAPFYNKQETSKAKWPNGGSTQKSYSWTHQNCYIFCTFQTATDAQSTRLTVTRQRFKPGPFCALLHTNHSATIGQVTINQARSLHETHVITLRDLSRLHESAFLSILSINMEHFAVYLWQTSMPTSNKNFTTTVWPKYDAKCNAPHPLLALCFPAKTNT